MMLTELIYRRDRLEMIRDFLRSQARIFALTLAIVLAFTLMPCSSFALTGETDEEGDTAGSEIITEAVEIPETAAQPDAELPQEEELLMQYLDRQVAENADAVDAPKRTSKSSRRSRLSEQNKLIYDSLRAQIEEVAAGSRTSTVFEVPLSSVWEDYLEEGDPQSQYYLYRIAAVTLGADRIYEQRQTSDGAWIWEMTDAAQTALYDISAVIDALLIDLPYDLFWFDKTAQDGFSYHLNTWISDGTDIFFDEEPAVTVSLRVSADYRSGSSVYETDAALIGRTADAAAVIGSIIDSSSGLSDIEKITAYKSIICEYADYDNDSAQNGVYGDPWQLISVFDGDPSTNVVCEGYSKAFQYLCDLSTFNDEDVECRTVTGTIDGGSVQGDHMWNLLHMDDGMNYIADITNSDDGTIGSGGQLFLRGYETGSVYEQYTFRIDDSRTVSYVYDESCRRQYDTAELELTENDYSSCSHDWTEWSVTEPATCTRPGKETRSCRIDPSHIQTRVTGDVDPDNHTLKVVAYVAPTVGTLGRNQYYRCTECGKCFRDKECTVETRPEDEAIPELISISSCSFTLASKAYTGKALTTTITAKYGSRKLVSGTDFTVTYSNNKNVGRGKAVVKGKGAYTGTRTLYFNITPYGTSLTKVSKAKKAFTVKWKKQTAKMSQAKITGYQIQYSTDKSFKNDVHTVTVTGATKASKKVSKLKAKTTYYVRIRTYMKVSGVTYSSGWSSAKSVKTK